ncbi:hypothetical protein [Sphingomonas glacialis]|uniref:Uncharacterized protein n=1 Tax=Sphingomonas glacialis TaxID=658225 RepID=A0A502FRD7_9SPHN|nr:hypothetical protein [Sphingomonas glacialis]TPG51959.1 hypothetical protein EAH76_14580 [Sphingomonas glacialis]
MVRVLLAGRKTQPRRAATSPLQSLHNGKRFAGGQASLHGQTMGQPAYVVPFPFNLSQFCPVAKADRCSALR